MDRPTGSGFIGGLGDRELEPFGGGIAPEAVQVCEGAIQGAQAHLDKHVPLELELQAPDGFVIRPARLPPERDEVVLAGFKGLEGLVVQPGEDHPAPSDHPAGEGAILREGIDASRPRDPGAAVPVEGAGPDEVAEEVDPADHGPSVQAGELHQEGVEAFLGFLGADVGKVAGGDFDVGHRHLAALGELDTEGAIFQDVGEEAGAPVFDFEGMAAKGVLGQGLLFGVFALGHVLEGFEARQDLGEEFAGVGKIETIDTPPQGFEGLFLAVVRDRVTGLDPRGFRPGSASVRAAGAAAGGGRALGDRVVRVRSITGARGLRV